MSERTCEWTYSGEYDDDYWTTGCGRVFCMMDGTWRDNEYKYCPNCGGLIWEDGGDD